MRVLWREWKKLIPYFSLLDFGASPTSRVGWIVRVAVFAFALIVFDKRVRATVEPLLDARPPPPLPAEEIDDYAFRLPEHERKQIFADIARAEQDERARAIEGKTWDGHLWSREDDRGHAERTYFRSLATKYRVSLSVIYLVMDEGIRKHWPGPDGTPLPATSPPLDIRATW